MANEEENTVDDKDLKANWLQEKAIGVMIVIIGAMIAFIVNDMRADIKGFVDDFKEANQAIQRQVDNIRDYQSKGAKFLGEKFTEQDYRIKINANDIELLKRKHET